MRLSDTEFHIDMLGAPQIVRSRRAISKPHGGLRERLHGDYFPITDTYDPLSNRRALYDTSQVLPAALLWDYVKKWPTPRLKSFRYMLRNGMMGCLTVMQNTNACPAEDHVAAKQGFALYKEKLRSFIRDADLYHISARPDGVHKDGIEYYDVEHARGWCMLSAALYWATRRTHFPCMGSGRTGNTGCISRMIARPTARRAALICRRRG